MECVGKEFFGGDDGAGRTGIVARHGDRREGEGGKGGTAAEEGMRLL
jgi:hypothetical protein